jgi:hypothetical protein
MEAETMVGVTAEVILGEVTVAETLGVETEVVTLVEAMEEATLEEVMEATITEAIDGRLRLVESLGGRIEHASAS